MLTFRACDVVTARAFGGNPLALVLGADDMMPAQMLALGREFNLSETRHSSRGFRTRVRTR